VGFNLQGQNLVSSVRTVLMVLKAPERGVRMFQLAMTGTIMVCLLILNMSFMSDTHTVGHN